MLLFSRIKRNRLFVLGLSFEKKNTKFKNVENRSMSRLKAVYLHQQQFSIYITFDQNLTTQLSIPRGIPVKEKASQLYLLLGISVKGGRILTYRPADTTDSTTLRRDRLAD